jgi:Antitoxin VbhA
MDDLQAQTDADKRRVKPVISPEEIEHRRTHVRIAIADSRIEGFSLPSRREKRIHDAFVRGDINAAELMAEITLMVRQQQQLQL